MFGHPNWPSVEIPHKEEGREAKNKATVDITDCDDNLEHMFEIVRGDGIGVGGFCCLFWILFVARGKLGHTSTQPVGSDAR